MDGGYGWSGEGVRLLGMARDGLHSADTLVRDATKDWPAWMVVAPPRMVGLARGGVRASSLGVPPLGFGTAIARHAMHRTTRHWTVARKQWQDRNAPRQAIGLQGRNSVDALLGYDRRIVRGACGPGKVFDENKAISSHPRPPHYTTENQATK